jgi:hypothetical protein
VGILDVKDLHIIKEPVLKYIRRQYSWFDHSCQLVAMPDNRQGFMNMKTGKIYIPGVN